MNSKAPILMLILSVVAVLVTVFCPLPAVGQNDIFRTSYECSDLKGNPRWKAVTEIFASPEKGAGINTLIERGTGIYGGFKEEISWQSELEYTRENEQIKPVKNHTVIFNTSGELISVENQEFDYTSSRATFTREDKKSGKVYKEVFTIKEDIVNRLILGLYIQQFLKKDKKETVIQMLSNEPKLIRCRLYIVGEEEIEVTGQKMQAYKLCLDPQLGLLNFVKVLIPKSYVWHSAKPDFEWLKYNGLEVNLSSPIVEIKKSEYRI